jgi:hypothetical protein
MGHVLGIGTLWGEKGLLTNVGTPNPRFTGAHATAEYNAIFGANGTSVPVENTGAAASQGTHWRESIFGNELMSSQMGAAGNPLSRVTVASLWDLGYTVKLNAADAYP